MILDHVVIEHLRQLCFQDDDPAFFQHLIEQFIEALLLWDAEFVGLNDEQQVQALHTLYGRCGSMGAVELSQRVQSAREAKPTEYAAKMLEVKQGIAQSITAFRQLLCSGPDNASL